MGSGASSPFLMHDGELSKCLCRSFPCVCHQEKGKRRIPVSTDDIAYEIGKFGKSFISDGDKIIEHNLDGKALEQRTAVKVLTKHATLLVLQIHTINFTFLRNY